MKPPGYAYIYCNNLYFKISYNTFKCIDVSKNIARRSSGISLKYKVFRYLSDWQQDLYLDDGIVKVVNMHRVIRLPGGTDALIGGRVGMCNDKRYVRLIISSLIFACFIKFWVAIEVSFLWFENFDCLALGLFFYF